MISLETLDEPVRRYFAHALRPGAERHPGMRLVATWDVAPERPEVHIRIAADGAKRSSCVMRWDNGEHGRHGYIPCDGDAHAERRFGDVVIPSRLTAGWWYGTARYDPFFEAEIHAAEPITASAR